MSDPNLHPDFFDLVGNVRAMRRLKPDPVPLDLIRKVLEAGVQAPSGQNLQPWSFVLISDPDEKRWFAERYAHAIESRFNFPREQAMRGAREQVARGAREQVARGDTRLNRQLDALYYQMDHMHEFPFLLLVCGKRDWPFKVPEAERVGLAPPNYGAVYPCVQNILLACRAVGLGAALTTMHQVFEEDLHAHFGIPESWGVVVTMPIGWPMGNFGPVKRRPAADVTYFNRWENKAPPPHIA